jgi:hypothetical protein
LKVCRQVTGSRKYPVGGAKPFQVELEKREEDRGRHLDPSVYGAPEKQRLCKYPEQKRWTRSNERQSGRASIFWKKSSDGG